jgi:hypothetical protein
MPGLHLFGVATSVSFKRVLGKLFFVILTWVLLTDPAQSATFYVSKAGSDSNPGTVTQPFLTVQKGVNTAQAGDTVLIGQGVYLEDIVTARNGANGAMITIDGQGIAKVRSFLLGHAYQKMQNLTIGGGTNLALVYMYRNADFCIFTNNVFDAEFNVVNVMSWMGPDARPFGNAGSDNLVINNTFKHAKGSIVLGVFGDRNVFRGNQFLDSDSVDWLRIYGRSNLVSGNVFSNCFVSGTIGNHPDFFQVFGTQGFGSLGTVIDGNTVIGMDGAAQLCMMSADDIPEIRDFTFRNNLFIGVSAKGTVACNDVKWLNNVFYHCSTNSFTGGSVINFIYFTNALYTNLHVNSAHGARVMNNVFLNCGDSRTNVGWYTFVTSLTNVVADYNYVGKSGFQRVRVDPLRRAIGDPSGWDNWAWWEPHGINGGNPLFANILNSDFRLEEGSPLIGAGFALNELFTTDMRSTTRGAQWDIGPLQFKAGEPVLRPRQPTNLRVSPH